MLVSGIAERGANAARYLHRTALFEREARRINPIPARHTVIR